MKKPFRTTLIMLVIAGAASAAAARFYPWPTPESDRQQPASELFADYDSTQVRGLEIREVDSASGTIRRLHLRRTGNQWTVPARGNYLASNAARLAAALGALADCRILRIVSEDQRDHELYGVVEPGSVGFEALPGTGTLVVYEDRNSRPYVSLIIGRRQGDERSKKRVVRLSGQPHVYEVEIDEAIFTARFDGWVDRDLFRLPKGPSGLATDFRRVEIEYSLVEPDKLTEDPPPRRGVYRAFVRRDQERLAADWWLPAEDGTWGATPAAERSPLTPATTAGLIGELTLVSLEDVVPKAPPMAAALAEPSTSARPADFQSGVPFGFRAVDFRNQQHQFVSSSGKTSVVAPSGMCITAYFGNLHSVDTSGGQLKRLMMLTAEVDEAEFPEPPAPEAGPEGRVSEEAQREFLKQRGERDKSLEGARQQAREFNQLHAAWYYVIGEPVVLALRPELAQLQLPAAGATGASNPPGSAGTDAPANVK